MTNVVPCNPMSTKGCSPHHTILCLLYKDLLGSGLIIQGPKIKPALETLLVLKYLGQQEVQQTPQLTQIVLQRRACGSYCIVSSCKHKLMTNTLCDTCQAGGLSIGLHKVAIHLILQHVNITLAHCLTAVTLSHTVMRHAFDKPCSINCGAASLIYLGTRRH